MNDFEVCEKYIDGLSINQISKICGYSPSKVRNILVYNKVNLRPKSIFNRSQINSLGLDIDYFKNIDNFDKAYWLGVISSDGTLSNDGYKVSLTSKDLDLVEKFKKSIKSDHKISIVNNLDKRTNKSYKRYLIQIGSKKFVENIVEKGITSNKSYVSYFPKIKKLYYNDFIRGLFDGDGSIQRVSNNSIRISFIASKEILDSIQKIFIEFNIENHPVYKVSNNMNVYRTHYFKDSLSILNYLYKNSNELTRLYRKYQIYIEYKNREPKFFDKSLIDRVINKFKNGFSIKNIASDEKMTVMTISKILHESGARYSKRFKNLKEYNFFDRNL